MKAYIDNFKHKYGTFNYSTSCTILSLSKYEEHLAWVRSLIPDANLEGEMNRVAGLNSLPDASMEIHNRTTFANNLQESPPSVLGSVICDAMKTEVSEHFEKLKENFLAVEHKNNLLTQQLKDKEDEVKNLNEQIRGLTEKAKMKTCIECEKVIDQPIFCNNDCLK